MKVVEQRVGEGEDILEHDQREHGGRNDQQAFAGLPSPLYRLKVSGYAGSSRWPVHLRDDASIGMIGHAGAFERGAGEAENDDGRQQAHLPPSAPRRTSSPGNRNLRICGLT